MNHEMTFDRRRLLAAGTALAAAPLFVPSRAFGANDRITLATIGAGGMGKGNTKAFLEHDDCQVVAICDVAEQHNRDNYDPDKAPEFGRGPVGRMVNEHYAARTGKSDYKSCEVYSDFREVIARDDIDAVCIATPDHWHGIIAIAAAHAKKDIFCQKPITHTFGEGKALMDAVARNDVVFQTGSQQRSTFNFRWAVELVLNGHIGLVRHVQVGLPTGHKAGPGPKPGARPPEGLDYDFWCGPSERLEYHPDRCHWSWRWHLAYGGGQLMDWIGHHNDIAHWGLGRDLSGPVQVHADGFAYPPDRTVWNAAHSYEVFSLYDDGVTVSLSNKHAMGCKWIGESGWVFVDRGRFAASDMRMTQRDFDRGPIRAYESQQHERNFLDCIISRKPCICPAETGHRSITPGHLGLVSEALGGRIIKWDPAAQRVVSDEEAQKLLEFNPRSPWKLSDSA